MARLRPLAPLPEPRLSRRAESPMAGRLRNRYRRLVNWLTPRLLPGALAVIFATAIWQALTLPDFTVDRVVVAGNRLVTSADIIEAAAIPTNNIFLLDRAAARAAVARIKRLASVEVRLLLPGTVAITVAERRPVAIWEADGARWLVDEEGLVLGPAGEEPLPRVVDLDNAAVAVESMVPAAVVEAGRAAVEGARGDLGLPIDAVDYRRDEGLSFQTGLGWRAVLGMAEAERLPGESRARWAMRQREYVAAKLELVRAVAEELQRSRLSARQVDVRFADRPYVR